MRRIALISVIAATVTYAAAQSVYPGQFDGKFALPIASHTEVEAFDLCDVRILPSRFRDNMERDSAWMTSIDVNRLVHSFRNNAGVFASREGGYMTVKKYGGWESLDCDLRGHTAGHLMSAYALMYAATGSDIFKAKGDSIISALDEVQQALGNGYLSAFPENLIQRNIAGKSVWAPWYTLHKILSGLIDQYLYVGNDTALSMASRMGEWAYNLLSPLDEATRLTMLRNEFGGINEAFYNLFSLTGDDRFRWLAEYFYHNDVIDPLKMRNADMGTKHTNTFIPKVLGEIRRYEILGDTASRGLASFFWHNMIDNHIFAPGCLSDKEHFFDTKNFSDHISGYTGETCCTYNMLKLSKHLFCHHPDEKIADYYERALINHILGQQDTVSGMVAYFLPLKSGCHKMYSTPENSFWCCVGSGFENHAKYGEAIYFHNDKDLYINLFIPSRLLWHEQGLTLTQTSDFPYSGNISFTIDTDAPKSLNLKLRYPQWCSNASVRVNGRPVKHNASSGEYIVISRKWQKGDRVELELPMSVHLHYAPDNDNLAAIMYGPIVLAGELGVDGITAPAPFSDPSMYNDYYTYNYHIPDSLNVSIGSPFSLVPVGHKARFVSADSLSLAPLFDVHGQRYAVYFNLKE